MWLGCHPPINSCHRPRGFPYPDMLRKIRTAFSDLLVETVVSAGRNGIALSLPTRAPNDEENKFDRPRLTLSNVDAKGVLYVKSIMTFSLGLLLLLCGVAPLYAAKLPTAVPLAELREELSAPSRLTVDSVGNLYVADRRRKAVLQFDPSGLYQEAFDNVPVSGTGLAVSADDQYLLIADKRNVNIVSIATGEAVGQLGSDDEFGRVGAIDVAADGNIFVVESKERLIKVYQLLTDGQNVVGQQLYSFGQNRFSSIFTMAIDRANQEVYVVDDIRTDTVQRRVEIFDLAGNWRRSLLFDSDFGSEKLDFISEIEFDDVGRIYFADKKNNSLRILDTDGTYLGTILSGGHSAEEIWQPRGLAFSSGDQPGSGLLLIANSDGRVSFFGLDGYQPSSIGSGKSTGKKSANTGQDKKPKNTN